MNKLGKRSKSMYISSLSARTSLPVVNKYTLACVQLLIGKVPIIDGRSTYYTRGL